MPLRRTCSIVLDIEKRLVSFIDHETNCVSQTIAAASRVPTGINNIFFGTNLVDINVSLNVELSIP